MSTWKRAIADPSAGVPLAPRVRYCPRCGYEKGDVGHTKPGLCRSCASTMTMSERMAWAA